MAKDARKIAVVGGGKIGELVVALLAQRYAVTVYDQDGERAKKCAAGVAEAAAIDAKDETALQVALKGKVLVVNCCPHFLNLPIARAARALDISYCDLSEDVASSKAITELSEGASGCFVPQSGLAPGFIQIAASHIMSGYQDVERAHLRVGALPENPTNALKYNLTWSTDGLINECGNPCEAIVKGEPKMLQPLEGLERVMIDGVEYEAFNTSGGLGSLGRTMVGKVNYLNYKTLRYLGHRDLMKFLLFDLKLNEYRNILKQILESAVPATTQDMVVVLVSVVGRRAGLLQQQTYTKVVRHGDLYGRHWTAIQLTTASGAAAVVELIMQDKMPHKGIVKQEEISFHEFCGTPYGEIFRE